MSMMENVGNSPAGLSELETRILELKEHGGNSQVLKSLQLKNSSTSTLLVITNYSMT